MPYTSVLSPCLAPSRRITVLAPPTWTASSETVSSSGSTARLSGIVSESPAQSPPSPARRPGSPASSHSIAS